MQQELQSPDVASFFPYTNSNKKNSDTNVPREFLAGGRPRFSFLLSQLLSLPSIDPPIIFYSPWDNHKGTANNKFCVEALEKLAELFSIGHKNMKRRITSDKEHEILIQ